MLNNKFQVIIQKRAEHRQKFEFSKNILYSPYLHQNSPKKLRNQDFEKKGQYSPLLFLAKMVLFSLYLQKYASDFDDFCTDVRNSCPE